MELSIERVEDGPEFVRVPKRLNNAEGRPIGVANDNPILDTRMYEFEYSDGYKTILAANTISGNLFAQVDVKGNRHVLSEDITDHRTDGKEVKQQDAFTTNSRGVWRRRETEVVW